MFQCVLALRIIRASIKGPITTVSQNQLAAATWAAAICHRHISTRLILTNRPDMLFLRTLLRHISCKQSVIDRNHLGPGDRFLPIVSYERDDFIPIHY